MYLTIKQGISVRPLLVTYLENLSLDLHDRFVAMEPRKCCVKSGAIWTATNSIFINSIAWGRRSKQNGD